MNLRDLIFEKDGSEQVKQPEPTLGTPGITFPPSFPPPGMMTPALTAPVLSCEPYMGQVMELYETGFDSLNKEGYDFYEYFKAILKGGVDNPLIYDMAFQMAKGMDKTVTKERLLGDSDFYIQELDKVFSNYVAAGKSKKDETIHLKKVESEKLTKEVSEIDKEISRLTSEKRVKEEALQSIDKKYDPTVQEIDCKLLANQTARDTLVGSIKKVKEGLTTNVN